MSDLSIDDVKMRDFVSLDAADLGYLLMRRATSYPVLHPSIDDGVCWRCLASAFELLMNGIITLQRLGSSLAPGQTTLTVHQRAKLRTCNPWLPFWRLIPNVAKCLLQPLQINY